MITNESATSNQQNAHTRRRPLWESARRFALTWGPPLLIMLLMFVFSAQPKTPPADHREGVYFSGVMPIFTEYNWETVVKKGSHVAGYGLLALLIMRALRIERRPLREAAHLAVLLAISYALTDELHQAFVPGRHASVLDIGFDYVGAASACLLACYILEHRAENMQEPAPYHLRGTPEQ